jgi:hypothetical protein
VLKRARRRVSRHYGRPGASLPPQPMFDAECWVAIRWAPDGTSYTVSRPGASSFQVFAADGSPRSGRIMLHGEGPTWSPDSRWVSGQDCPSPALCVGGYYVIRPDGTDVRDLPGRPAWSANGAVLAVAAPDGSLWVGRPDGTDLRDIGQFPCRWLVPRQRLSSYAMAKLIAGGDGANAQLHDDRAVGVTAPRGHQPGTLSPAFRIHSGSTPGRQPPSPCRRWIRRGRLVLGLGACVP